MPLPYLSIFPTNVIEQLIANYRKQLPLKGTPGEIDFQPVCKLFLPWTSGTWLLTELEEDYELAFGLCDLGYPELGYVSLAEIYDVVGPAGLRVEMDIRFNATQTISQYATEARQHGSIRA